MIDDSFQRRMNSGHHGPTHLPKLLDSVIYARSAWIEAIRRHRCGLI